MAFGNSRNSHTPAPSISPAAKCRFMRASGGRYSRLTTCTPENVCVGWRRQSALDWQPASQGKKIYSQTEIQTESRRGKTPSHTASLLGFFFFFPWEGLSQPTCVKVCFVFAAGLRHKASGSCLVKCWWRYYKVKSRVYKPAVCMVRAFPAEQWVSKLVW